MKHRLLLPLLVLLLGGAAWWLLADDGPAGSGALEGTSWIDEPSGDGPGLGAEGTAPAEAPPPPPPPTRPAEADGRPELAGRVVDERRRPVAGAQVELRLGTRVLGRAVSDAAGRYALAPALASPLAGARGAVLARAPDGRTGVAAAWITSHAGPGARLPDVVVRGASVLTVRVVREGAGVLGARACVVRRASGAPLPVATADADEQGRVVFPPLPDGVYEIYASAIGHGRGVATARLPRSREEGVLEVALVGERTLEVVVVDARTQRPVAGAEVLVGDRRTMPEPHGPGYLPAFPAPRTSRSGLVQVRRLAQGEAAYVNVRARGYALAPWWRHRDQQAAPGTSEVRVELARARAVRFPIVEGDVPAPPDGTVLDVSSGPAGRGASTTDLRARVDGGYVLLEGVGPGTVTGTLVAPDGAQAAFQAQAEVEEGPTVTFRRPRLVRVRVLEPDGSPVAGLGLRLTPVGRVPRVEPATTGTDGVATFVGVGGERATVHRLVSDQPFGGPALGTLDLLAEQEVHDLVLQPGVSILLRLEIEGAPALPATYTLLVAGQRLDPAEVQEDPAAGELRFDVRPPAPEGELGVDLHAEGFLPESLELDAADPGPVERTIVLRPAGKLVVHVRPPEDGEFVLQLQRRDADDEGWSPARLPVALGGSAGPAAGPQGGRVQTFEGLAPGVYRALDRRSQTASEPVRVTSGGAALETTLDLGASIWITGRVEAPAGAKLVQARVLVEGRDDPAQLWTGVRPAADGAFRVRARRGERITLHVAHPTLTPAARGGRVTTEAGRGEVVLRLEAGAELRFRAAGFDDAHTPASGLWHAPLQVHLLPEPGAGGAPLTVQPLATRGLFRVGGFQPGTYTVWITFGSKYAPYVRRGLELGAGGADLGTLSPGPGSTLRVRVAGLAERPQVTVWAVLHHVGQPTYTRHGALDRASGELRAEGLGAGRFRVVVRAAGLSPGAPGMRVLLEREVEVDGRGERVLDLRLP